MAVEIENVPQETVTRSALKSGDSLRAQIEAIRARGHQPIQWDPITIKGEPLSVTIIRERRGDFDDDSVSG